MRINDKILVAGAGGFIGGAQIALLRKQGYRDLRAVDVKAFDEWYQRFDDESVPRSEPQGKLRQGCIRRGGDL
jgi:nucleoside-diphosphate-sugar epimerase